MITLFFFVGACSATIYLAPSKEPTEINLNVKIENENSNPVR
ncbi:MAG: hypothetical protein CMQ33_05390 [Gammaproteobacteria bacterium]|nr:hypothetical protein [Gammaproteobacteria bacterium]